MTTAHGLKRAAAGLPPAVVSFISSTASTTDASSYTFSDVSTGVGLIVVAAHGDAGVALDLSSCTIGGSAATEVLLNNDLTGQCVGLFARRVTGGTNTIVVNFSATAGRCAIGVWRIEKNSNDVAHSTNKGGSSSNTSASCAVNVPAGGVIIAAMTSNNDNRVTWTGVTERYDSGPEALSGVSGGDIALATGEIGRTISADGASDARAVVAASWR
jgi:hypothetical protein